MAPARATPPLPPIPKGSYYPPNDAATHRDLLLFEERLKTNAASLNRRKRRYQVFLVQLLIAIVLLLSQVFMDLHHMLDGPYRMVLRKFMSKHKTLNVEDMHVHPFVASGLLFVSVTTLLLFFASGMYSEKIAYANRYVPHANRALRNFNMYLNLRKPPLRSLNPFAKAAPPTNPPLRQPSPARMNKRSPSSVPIPTIPPSNNPRGELIFSSKVDRGFRDSYDKYRSAFERRREEREREAFFTKSWLGRFLARLPFISTPTSVQGHGTGMGSADFTRGSGHSPMRSISGSSTGSLRGRPGGTPGGSRRSSPPLSSARGGSRGGPSRVGSNSRSGTPSTIQQDATSCS